MNLLCYNKLWEKLPKWFRVTLVIISILTMIWWAMVIIYNLLKVVRKILHTISDEKHWWFFICCVVGVMIGAFFVAQFWLNLNPYGKLIDFIVMKIKAVRVWIGGIIMG